LQSVLPKLLLPRAVEEWKVAYMVDEDVSEDRQLAIDGGDFAKGATKRGAEALQGSWRIELVYFELDLPRDEFSFEVSVGQFHSWKARWVDGDLTVLLLSSQNATSTRASVSIGDQEL
jgi:hypothetical protein